ncbi:MAG: aldose 1-epimerase family protein [Cyclobacteriaceae bacterium]
MKIQNEYLLATFKSKGAELTSLTNQTTGMEYIWQANPKHWGRHAPVLFPIVGKLKNDQFSYEGKTYTLGQHGFARDMDFELEKTDDQSIVFLLKSNDQTLAVFPFKFELRIQYRLSGQSLLTTYQVTNADTQKPMFFSIGGHPAFNVPMNEDGSRAEFQIGFSNKETQDAYLLNNGVFDDSRVAALMDGQLPVERHTFDKDALVFKNLSSNEAHLLTGEHPFLSFKFDGFPFLGIWSKNQESPFVCIEPWFGIADHQKHNGILQEKEGIQTLSPLSTFTCSYQIATH